MHGLHDSKAAELIIGYGETLGSAMGLHPGFAIVNGWDKLVEHARTLREQLTVSQAHWMSMPNSEIERCVAVWKAGQATRDVS